MTKKLLMLHVFFLTTIMGFCQYPDSVLISYHGGYYKLNQLVSYELSVADVTSTDLFYKNPYLYYQAIFEVDGNGNVGDVLINSLNDSVLSSSLYTAIKKTNGAWINHTGEKLRIILPVYYNIFNEGSGSNKSLKELYEQTDNSASPIIYNSFYNNGPKVHWVRLKPIKIVAMSPVH